MDSQEELNDKGLSYADVEKRKAAGQVNRAVRKTGRSAADIVRTNVFTRINAILGVLFVIVISTGSWINGAFGLLIIANSAIGIVQELRAKRTLDKLTILGESKPTVIREGKKEQIVRDEIVIDELIEVGSGDQLVVDGIVKTATGLFVDESMLTGEADSVHKEVGDELRSGSFITRGSGTYQATAIGADAYAAKLVAEAGRFTLTDSELQKGINKILKIITWLLVPTGLLTIWTQLGRTGAPWKDAVLSMVASIVPMVPEGLVLMTSIAFAVGVVRLGKRQALINELPAIEGLARVNVVCADKTGTLTENRMELDSVHVLGKGAGGEPSGEVAAKTPGTEAVSRETISREAIGTALASMPAAEKRPNDTMQAIAAGVGGAGLGECETSAIAHAVPFDSSLKWSGVCLENGQSWVIGAPDVLLAESAPELEQVKPFIDQGLRVLLLARCSDLDAVSASPSSPGCSSLEPAALVVLRQKVRDDAAETLEFFGHEGVEVKIISGDNAVSVGAVAQQLGIENQPVDARTLPTDAQALEQAVNDGQVFGRVTPEQKRDMVGALQRTGHTVAMTGDGVNDVLALKDANIGVSMGSGSPATRSVAQVVLLDNKFATLPHVVAEGRRVIGNIERVANLFLTKTIYSVVLALVVGIFGITFPFQPIHVTMVGWFTIGIPAFILSLAPNYERARPGFVRRVLRLALPSGLLIGVLTVIFWIVHQPSSGDAEHLKEAGSATLVVLIVMALWVLTIVARPYVWWKVLLLACAWGFYALVFLFPWLAHLLLLDVSDSALLMRALVWGAAGAVLIEIAWQVGQRLDRSI